MTALSSAFGTTNGFLIDDAKSARHSSPKDMADDFLTNVNLKQKFLIRCSLTFWLYSFVFLIEK